MSYKIAALVKSGFKFNNIYPDKQKFVAQTTNMDFTLQEIVDYLSRQTNNFTLENSVAQDLDTAIYSLVEKYHNSTGDPLPEPEPAPTPAPVPEPAPAPSSPNKSSLKRRISMMKEMLEEDPENKSLKRRLALSEEMLLEMDDDAPLPEKKTAQKKEQASKNKEEMISLPMDLIISLYRGFTNMPNKKNLSPGGQSSYNIAQMIKENFPTVGPMPEDFLQIPRKTAEIILYALNKMPNRKNFHEPKSSYDLAAELQDELNK